MKLKNPFNSLTVFEWCLWILSLAVVTLSFLLSPERDSLTLTASLVGVTALIFVAKGMVFGQVLTVIFAVLYGIVSLFFAYYGEVITYLALSAPAAIASVISWIKNPYKSSNVVRVGTLNALKISVAFILTVLVTIGSYFLLGALNTANLTVSTLSVATSFLASALTFLRSPYYALAYAANDIVLIVLWIMASIENIAYLPMIFCFVMFFANDIYGFINWRRMKRTQQ